MPHNDALWLRLKIAALLSLPVGAAFADEPPTVDASSPPAAPEVVKVDPALAYTKIQEQVSKLPKDGGELCFAYAELTAATLGGLEPKDVEKAGTCPSYVPIVSEMYSDGESLTVQFTPKAPTPAAENPPPQESCCYDVAFIREPNIPRPVLGRPLTDAAGHAHIAPPASSGAWSASQEGALTDGLGPVACAYLADQWLHDALSEHASIASFARVSLELMSLGAPPDLLADVHRAALDEIDHARRCFDLASAYAQTPLSAGPLLAPAPRVMAWESLAKETFLEGCVGESCATLRALRQRRDAEHPQVIETLSRIIDDEAKHAAVAWKTVAWAIQNGGASVKEALREAATQARAALTPPDSAPIPLSPSALAAHGRLSPSAEHQALQDAWEHIISPTLHDLLDA